MAKSSVRIVVLAKSSVRIVVMSRRSKFAKVAAISFHACDIR